MREDYLMKLHLIKHFSKLRVGPSKLDLNHNFRDINDPCAQKLTVEDTDHYLLQSSTLDTQRQDPLARLRTLSLEHNLTSRAL